MKLFGIFFTVTFLFLASYFFYGKYSTADEPIETETTFIEQQELLASEEQAEQLTTVREKQKNIQINVFNSQEIMQLSEQVQTCEDEQLLIEDEKKLAAQQIKELLDKEFVNPRDLYIALNYLLSKGLIDFQKATELFEQIQMSRWNSDAKEIVLKEDLDEQALKFRAKLTAFQQALLSEDISELDHWLKSSPEFTENKYLFVTPEGRKSEFSYQAVLGGHFHKFSEPYQKALLERFDIGSHAVNAALRSNSSIDTFSQLLEKSSNANYFHQQGKRTVNLLSSALEAENIEAVELLINRKERYQHRLITSPVNHYIWRKLLDPEKLEASLSVLKKLSDRGYFIVLVPNIKNKTTALQGYPHMRLTRQVIDKLKNAGIKLSWQYKWKEPDNSLLASDEKGVLNELIEPIKQVEQQLKNIRQDCKQLKSELTDLEPDFKDSNVWKKIIANYSSFPERVAALSQASPVLVDLYRTSLLHNSIENTELLDDIIETFNQETYGWQQLVTIVDKLRPEQQNYIVIKLCNQYGRTPLEVAVENNWYISSLESDYQGCIEQVKDFYTIAAPIIIKGLPEFSEIYQSINTMDYRKAGKLLVQGVELNGFKEGRDSLALLLDRMIVFGQKVKPVEKQLLMQLIGFTNLTSVHYRRLKRLQLKLPEFFADLIDRYPELIDVESYPVSQYHSYL